MMSTVSMESAAFINLFLERIISKSDLMIARGQPYNQFYQSYSVFYLQRSELGKRSANIEVVDLFLTRLIESLKKNRLMKKSGELLVVGSIDSMDRGGTRNHCCPGRVLGFVEASR